MRRLRAPVVRLVLAAALAGAHPGAHAAEVAGVKIDESMRSAGAELKLNGAGLRSKAFFRVYALGLYLQEKKATAADVLASAGPKRIMIHMLRDVDAGEFSEALEDGIRENHSEADVKALAPRTALLGALMKEVKQARKGMVIALDWMPGAGTQVTIDGQQRGKPIEGEDFYRALLRIWLGEKPVSGELKRSLLGQAG